MTGVTVIWPANLCSDDIQIPVNGVEGERWERLPDGRIRARYTVQQLHKAYQALAALRQAVSHPIVRPAAPEPSSTRTEQARLL